MSRIAMRSSAKSFFGNFIAKTILVPILMLVTTHIAGINTAL